MADYHAYQQIYKEWNILYEDLGNYGKLGA